MKIIVFLILLFPFFSAFSYTQGLEEDKSTYDLVKNYFSGHDTGVITIINDPRLDTLLYRHIQSRAEMNGIRGYRIQIYFGSGRNAREEANTAKAKCISFFPDQEVYILYQTPFYKVRVGDFRTRNEAYIWHKKIVSKFPQAYIVNDIINFPEL